MLDRLDKTSLGIAAAGHVVLFALLSASLIGQKDVNPPPPSLDISLVDDVALDAAAPAATEAPALSQAPDLGPPEDSAPPEPIADPAPEPAPQPSAAPPKPAPKPSQSPPPRPARQVAKTPPLKPSPPRPAPAKPAAQPAKQAAKAPARPPARQPARPSARPGTGTQVASTGVRPRGGSIGDIMKGISASAAPKAAGQTPRGAVMSARAAADIGSAIQRQVQPCAERQVLNAPGAERIAVTIALSLNRDGSLAARPQVVSRTGVDDDNSRYVKRVDDLTIAAFTGCSPLRGLPADLYDVPRGWKNFKLRFKLPG